MEVAQDLGDGTAQNWLVYPDGRRVPIGCRYDVATGECVSAGATEAVPAPGQQRINATGRVTVWGGGLPGVWDEMRPLVAAAYPGLDVEVSPVPPRQAGQTQAQLIIANVVAGTAPDMWGADATPRFMLPYIDIDAVIPLDTYYDTLPNLQQVFTWAKVEATVKNHIWAVPTSSAFEGIWVNTAVAARASVRGVATTWSDFIDQALKLKTALADRKVIADGGTRPEALNKPPVPFILNFPGNAGTLFNLLRAAILGRGGISDILYGDGRWDTADMITVAQTAVDLQRQGILPPQPADDHYVGAPNFAQGNTAWWPVGSWQVVNFENAKKNNPGLFDYNFFGMPDPRGQRPPQLVGRNVGGFMINRASRNPDGAAALADVLIGADALGVWFGAAGGELMGPVIPINPGAYGLPTGFTAVLGTLASAGELPQNVEEMTVAEFSDFELQRVWDLLNGKIGPRDYAVQVQGQWQMLKSAGKLPTFAR
jgi:ABC-type glycerol-3-phosphate transport system substrate-binding protein